MKFWEYLTTPPVLEDEYANQILNLKISPQEVFDTVFFFVALIMVSPWYVMDENGELHHRLPPRPYRRVPPSLKWGHLPRYWF